MPYIITEACVGVKDASCVVVCPVDCIIATDADDMYFIDPSICIDCGACIPECPVDAIYVTTDMPAAMEPWTALNEAYFTSEREAFYGANGGLIAAAKQKNAGSPHANPALYQRP